MHACISRFFFDCEDEESVKRLYSTIVLFISINSVIIFTLLWCFNEQLAVLINLPTVYFKLALIISFLVYFIMLFWLYYMLNKMQKKVSVTSICVGVFQIFYSTVISCKSGK